MDTNAPLERLTSSILCCNPSNPVYVYTKCILDQIPKTSQRLPEKIKDFVLEKFKLRACSNLHPKFNKNNNFYFDYIDDRLEEERLSEYVFGLTEGYISAIQEMKNK